MAIFQGVDGSSRSLDGVLGTEDPVLKALGRAEDYYQDFRAQLERLQADLKQAHERLSEAEDHNRNLGQAIQEKQQQLEEEWKRAERQADRAHHLANSLKKIHRAMFGGNIFSLILKVCLTITGATRGLYITGREGERFRVRAATDVDGYPEASPSEFIRALCRQVIASKNSVVVNGPEDLANLPVPTRPDETFHNFIAAPVVLLANLNGIVIIADKLDGHFDREDVETVLGVGDQAGVALENQKLQHELQTNFVSIIGMLADVVEAKDPYTHGHCEMVSRLAHMTAKQLQLQEYDQSVACYAALLHDVGKIGVSDGILNKPGALLPEERDLMRAHVRVGHDLLVKVPALKDVANAVLHHHERYDGTGYPEGLVGETIPIAARIVCVVDAYHAMMTKRSYKEPYTEERARQELIQGARTQFDPQVIEALLTVLEREKSPDCPADELGQFGPLPGFSHPEDFQRLVQAHCCQEQASLPS